MIRCGYFPGLYEAMQEQFEQWLEYYWTMESPDVWVIDCARCGRVVEVFDPENRERDAFCDECAEEHVAYLEDENEFDITGPWLLDLSLDG